MAWDLTLTSDDGERRVIWSGESLTPLMLMSLLTRDISPHNIQEIVVQIIINSSSKSLSMLLSCLVCSYWRYSYARGTDLSVDVILRAFQEIIITKSLIPGNSHVCGVIFKKDELVWTCRECGKNDTCVLCDKCYKSSNHVGHEVYFHVASGGGGCCDCGDEEAWLKEGCCPAHYPKNDDSVDPISYLPSDLLRGLNAVISELIKVITIYAVGCVRGFNKKSDNIYTNRLENELRASSNNNPIVLIGRLHNDDVHSYDDVIGALKEFFPDKSDGEIVQMTTNIDKEGESLLFTTASIDKHVLSRTIVNADRVLGTKAGLLLSVVPQDLYQLDPKIATILAWFKMLGSSNDALRRVVTNLLFTDVEELCGMTTTTTAAYLPIFKMLLPIFSPSSKNQFPNCVPHVLRWNSASDSIPDIYIYPFDVCHRNPFAILMMGSPHLSKNVAKVINGIIVSYQHDRKFKYDFSQSLTILYPAIQLLFSRGIGEEERTILGTTVQVYTADSIVNYMSSDGVSSRLLPEFNKSMHVSSVYVTRMMTSTVKFLLKDIGCHRSRVSDEFLKDRFIHNRCKRLRQVLMDFDYLCEDTFSTLKVLCNERDPGVVDDLLQIFTCCQYLDKYNRRSETHVEFESDIWLPAAELVLKLTELSTSLLTNAFYPANISLKLNTTDISNLNTKRVEAINIIVNNTLLKLTEWSGSLIEDNSMLYLNNSDHSIMCLGVPVTFHGIRRFHVSFSAVSIHIPLQRFLTQSIIAAANSGTSLLHVLNELFCNPVFNLPCYVDYSIRCLSLSSQINVGMWKRNGSVMDTINHNYAHHLSRKFRDIDIYSVQFGIFSIGYDSTLAMFVDRFELTAMFEIGDYFLSADVLKEFKEPSLGLLLQFIIYMTTYLPEILVKESGSSDIGAGIRELVCREMIHKLIGGVNQISKLENMRNNLVDGAKDIISDAAFQSIIDELSYKRSLNYSDKYVLEIKPHILSYYYPEFPHLSVKQHSIAMEAVRKEKERLLDAATIASPNTPSNIIDLTKCSSPLFAQVAVPKATVHPDFLLARGILFTPLMFEMLNHSIRLCIARKGDKNTCSITILGRIVHIIQLQLYILPDYSTLLGTQELLGKVHVLFSLMDRNISSKSDDYAVSYLSKQQRLIELLADVFAGNILASENLYKYGFYWLVKEFYSNNHVFQSIFHRKNIMFGNTEDSQVARTTDADNSKKRAAEARSRAMNNMAKLSSKFVEMAESSDDDDGMAKSGSIDESNAGNENKAARAVSLEDECSECIICHMRTGEVIGYLSFLQQSTNIRNSIKGSMQSKSPLLYRVYRVVALSGCYVYSQPSSEVLSIISNDIISKTGFRSGIRVITRLSQGDHITSDRRVLNWVSINYPVSGWCKIYDSDATVLLYPIQELQFNKHGKSRVHASKCTHAVHYSCWKKYSSRYGRDSQQTSLISNYVDTARSEILCPLCKAITNCLIPHYPPHIAHELQSPFVHVTRSNKTLEIDSITKFAESINKDYAPNTSKCVHDASKLRPIEHSLTSALFIQYDYKWTAEKCQQMQLIIRDVHHLWSTISYTMLTTVTNHRWLKASFLETYSRDDGNIQLIRTLLAAARNSCSWFPDKKLHHDDIAIPLQALLQGGSIWPSHGAMESGFKLLDANGINVDQCRRLLSSLPYSGAETQPYSNDKIALILKLCRLKGIDIGRLWGILCIPLLSQDLHVISIACLSVITDTSNLDSIFCIMAIARLAQILIEPSSLGYCSYGSDEYTCKGVELSAEYKLVVAKLLDCRDLLCSNARIPCIRSYPTEAEGVEYLVGFVASLIPFLEFLCSLYYVILLSDAEGNSDWISSFERIIIQNNTSDSIIDLNGIMEYSDQLLSLQNMPKLKELLCSPLVPIALSSWGEQYAHVNSTSMSDDRPDHPWIPGSIDKDVDALMSSHSVISDNKSVSLSGVEAEAGMSAGASKCSDLDSNYSESENERDDNQDDDDVEEDGTLLGADGDFMTNFGNLTADHDINDIMEQLLAAEALDADPEAFLSNIQNYGLLSAKNTNNSAKKWNLYGIDPSIHATIDEPLTASERNRIISVHSDTPLQGTISGVGCKIYGYNGEELQYTFNDLSHYGLSLSNTPGIINLPLNYTDLYEMVKGDNVMPESPALCLLCCKVVHATNRRSGSRSRLSMVRDPGECTLHSRDCGVGVGIFFLLKQCRVLLIRDNHSVTLPSIYLDSRGEAAEFSSHTRPLFLSTKRYLRLKELYLKHLIGREVARGRASDDEVTMSAYY